MKFRKKPVIIEAHLWDGSVEALAKWLMTVGHLNDSNSPLPAKQADSGITFDITTLPGRLFVKTLAGEMLVSLGDWIICGVANELYPCKDEIFAKTYEFVDSSE